MECEVSKSSVGLGKEQLGQIPLDLQLQDVKKKEVDKDENSDVSIKTGLNPPDVNKSSISLFSPSELSNKQNNIIKQGMEASANSHSFDADGKQKVLLPKFYHDASAEKTQPSGGGRVNLEQTLNNSFSQGNSQLGRDFGVTGFGSGSLSVGEKVPVDSAGQFNCKESLSSVEMGKLSPVNVGITSLSSASSRLLSSGNFISAKDADVKSSLLPSSYTQGGGSENVVLNNTNVRANLAGKLVYTKEIAGASTTPQNSACILLESGGQKPPAGPGNIESLPSIRSSHISSQEIGILDGSAHHKHYPLKENYRNLPQSGMLNSEPNLSKQFGNVIDLPFFPINTFP